MSIKVVNIAGNHHMALSQKCQYALRAIFELSKRHGRGPVKIGEVAKAQAIPVRFLAGILTQLRQAGYVASRRGARGGYQAVRDPKELTVGEVIRFVDGPLSPVKCLAGSAEADCPLRGNCAFMGLWRRAQTAVAGVYDATTFQGLLDEEQTANKNYVASYCI
jgi:Rrf2 family cysteine metabolism transcriptional repressor